MQFIKNGPDIPNTLLHAHEEGRVVFFCGAGISYPAGLPGFQGLVKKIYHLNGAAVSDSEIEEMAFKSEKFDATLDLLEKRLPGRRLAVRRALAKALKPNLHLKGAVDTQAALLGLARSREGALRLVTTNFDRTFHVAAKRTNQKFHAYLAPMLPIPKNSRWDGLVYLHGLLPGRIDDVALNRLVITSGDFGLAYLTERWAARFVSELFRNYVVCFVGYSINDPVLRYMMDALAADRMLGESTPQAWAFGECGPDGEHQKTIEWEAKGVTPILYQVPPGSNDHSAMHLTLKAWAETYRDGIQGKETIIVKHAMAQPQESTRQDDFVGRMLWALSDKSGVPARRFAELNPTPSLDWLLEAFVHESLSPNDSPGSEAISHDHPSREHRHSLIRRPAPHNLAPLMQLVSDRIVGSQWDAVTFQLARWLVRHLNDPRLIIWITTQGGQLHDPLPTLIEEKLDHFASLKREGKNSELEEISLHAPNSIPNAKMYTLWRLLLDDQVKSSRHNLDMYGWQRQLKQRGLTASLRQKLRALLTPKISLRMPFFWNGNNATSTDQSLSNDNLLEWELVLNADHIHSTLENLDDEYWTSIQPLLLNDFQQLLIDALDLSRELGGANDRTDRSHWDLPSIAPHWQNRGFNDWVCLIELLRDAWISVHSNNKENAARIAQGWFELPYLTFKRLALFAASQDDCIKPEQWTKWLISDDFWWLWSIDTGREVYRLLALQGQHLSDNSQKLIEAAILEGPPRTIFEDDIAPDMWKQLTTRAVWLRLTKLSTSGIKLGKLAAENLHKISALHPRWQLEPHEREEFSHWLSGTGDPDFESSLKVDIAPRKRHELVEWLVKSDPEGQQAQEDTWRDVCRTRFFHSLSALRELAKNGKWPAYRWREALQVWAEEGVALRSWQCIAPLISEMTDSLLQEISRPVAWWLKSASKSNNHQNKLLLPLCARMLDLLSTEGPLLAESELQSYDPINKAINHPIGHITDALIHLWLMSDPNDNDFLPSELKPVFTKLCDTTTEQFLHGRVLLCSRLITFFRVDPIWTKKYLLPLLDWDKPIEAKAAWAGFLWSPRLYQPLLIAFKSHFLNSANHYADLGKLRRQFAIVLTYVALDPIEDYTVEELRTAIGVLPPDGLEASAQAVYEALEGATNQREAYWKNRVQPFWQKIWPKSYKLATPRISALLTRMVIAAESEFPAAMTATQGWIQPPEYLGSIVELLDKSDLCNRFPNQALSLLNSLINTNIHQPGLEKVGQCLNKISQAAPMLSQDKDYLRLQEHTRQQNQ